MFFEADKARIIGNIELKLAQIDLLEDNKQEENNLPVGNPSGNSTFLNAKMMKMIQINQEIIPSTKKRLKIIKKNTLKFKTINFKILLK